MVGGGQSSSCTPNLWDPANNIIGRIMPPMTQGQQHTSIGNLGQHGMGMNVNWVGCDKGWTRGEAEDTLGVITVNGGRFWLDLNDLLEGRGKTGARAA